jgi:hypothetical protein
MMRNFEYVGHHRAELALTHSLDVAGKKDITARGAGQKHDRLVIEAGIAAGRAEHLEIPASNGEYPTGAWHLRLEAPLVGEGQQFGKELGPFLMTGVPQ